MPEMMVGTQTVCGCPFDAIRLRCHTQSDVPFQYDDMFFDQYNVAQPIFATPTEPLQEFLAP